MQEKVRNRQNGCSGKFGEYIGNGSVGVSTRRSYWEEEMRDTIRNWKPQGVGDLEAGIGFPESADSGFSGISMGN